MMVTHRKEVYCIHQIWHLDITHKTNTRWQLPWMVTYHPRDGHPPSQGWSPTIEIWSPTFPNMVTHVPKAGHQSSQGWVKPPSKDWSPTNPMRIEISIIAWCMAWGQFLSLNEEPMCLRFKVQWNLYFPNYLRIKIFLFLMSAHSKAKDVIDRQLNTYQALIWELTLGSQFLILLYLSKKWFIKATPYITFCLHKVTDDWTNFFTAKFWPV